MKKNFVLKFLIFCTLLLGILLPSCNNFNEWKLNVSFQLNEREGYPRSDQMVIWLEKTDSTFVKTLYISEYLAYGGYNEPEICPDWAVKSNWLKVSQEEFDAITSATPNVGLVNMELSCSKEQVPEGDYNIFIEVHLTEDYNELYSGLVKISQKKDINTLLVSYNPKKYGKASYNVLSDVQVSLN